MATYTGFGAVSGPATLSTDASNTYTFGLEFYVTSAASLSAMQIWRPTTGMTGTITGRLYSVTTATTGVAITGTDVTFTLTGTGWQTAALTTPVALTVNQRYRAAINILHTYGTTAAYFSTGAGSSANTTNGPLVIPNNTNSTGGQNRYINVASTTTQTMSYPNLGGGDSYWLDVTVSTSGTVGGSSLNLNQAVSHSYFY